MRLRYLVPIAALGAAAVALLRRGRARRAESLIPDIDPKDSVQSLDDVVVLHVEELEVDAMPAFEAEALADLSMLDAEREMPNPSLLDSGDLYGQRVPAAMDRTHPDDDTAQADGENWVEALLEDSIEAGPEPERILDMTDEAELLSPSTDTRDRPVADRGSAGPRGL